MRIAAIPGSLNRSSSNSALLHAAAALPTGGDITIWEDLDRLPHFGPDRPGDGHVAGLRRAVGGADAVLIATPEYAGGMPGSLKNALDWLVGTGELYGKPLVIISAAPSAERGGGARRWVDETVRMQGASVRDSFTVPVLRSDGPDELAAKAGEALARARRALDATPPG
ncbi:MAG TPA: NAD(P)H-dependent oxidoreductase [Acidimicrobiales bacterium]|nr:NAD(P)H-dependent oxidoreductase [Acidimicrobiales bacterium]